jgi:hypothetical protein
MGELGYQTLSTVKRPPDEGLTLVEAFDTLEEKRILL